MTIEYEAAAKILRGVLSLARRLREERKDGAASPAAISLLGALYRLGPVNAVKLAADQRLQPQSLTRLLDSLEKKDLILRTPGPVDRRERLIALTREGRRVFEADIHERRKWLEAAMIGALSEEEREALLNAANAMIKLANSDPQKKGELNAAESTEVLLQDMAETGE